MIMGWQRIYNIRILEFDQYMKSDKMPYIIYADFEPSIRWMNGCANNPDNS